MVENFTTDGILGATAPGAYTGSGAYVTGTLPGTVTFANTGTTNDYNQLITFGNSFSLVSILTRPGPTHRSEAYSDGPVPGCIGRNPS